MVSAMRAGHSLNSALDLVAHEVARPDRQLNSASASTNRTMASN